MKEINGSMYCPICKSKETKVNDSRVATDGMSIRRRRECMKCRYRFSTLEEVELLDFIVIKNNGNREAYSRDKLEHGILQSLVKRSCIQERFQRLINLIERDIQKKVSKSGKAKEIKARDVGAIVMKHLKKFDKIAYIRFASIYRAFEDVKKFQSEVRNLIGKKKK